MTSLIPRASALRNRLDLREVDFELRNVVEVVGKDVEGDVGHDSGDLGVAEPRIAHCAYVFVTHRTALLNDNCSAAVA